MSHIQPFLALASVLALIWLIYRLFLILRPGLFGAHGKGPSMQLVERLSLGDKRHLLLVEVEGQRLVLGATPREISLVAELEEKTAAELEPDATGPANQRDIPALGRRFFGLLTQARQEGGS